MMKQFLISAGQRLQSISENQEIRQYIMLAIIPILVIAGYYVWDANFIKNPQPQVLSVNTDEDQKNKALTTQASEEATPKKEMTIKVDVSGAVNHPGLIELPAGSRVDDAIKKADGLNVYADKKYIAQALNLAQKLIDGDKIYLPTYYEVSISLPKPSSLVNKANQPLHVLSSSKSSEQGDKKLIKSENDDKETVELVNINEASKAELEELPGIG